MQTKARNDKEIKIPGPDHPITISPAEGKVRVTVAGKVIAESMRALRLEERGYPPVYYLPRDDADMSLLAGTNHYTHCPYKGDCTYNSIPQIVPAAVEAPSRKGINGFTPNSFAGLAEHQTIQGLIAVRTVNRERYFLAI